MPIEYNNYLKNLGNDDVLEFQGKLFKFEQLKNALNHAFDGERLPKELSEILKMFGVEIIPRETYRSGKNSYRSRERYDAWFKEGIDLKILKSLSSSGWQKGKIKIKFSIEFIPDDLEIPEYKSPLDEIRDEIRERSSFPNSQY
jgi:hypothetical protein